ncbi:MAG TPA: hypothetical protein VKV95_15270 [Terriglobia bacterium]|nr:hypothetical protein [Terriglobia bacterium]
MIGKSMFNGDWVLKAGVAVALLVVAGKLQMTIAAGGGKTPSDLPITNTLADFDATGTSYFVQSDGLGAYHNGVADVISILVANGYNHIVWGDWRLDLLSSSSPRKMGITLSTSNAVQPGDPGYMAPANPPFWGTSFEEVRAETKCSEENHDMMTMKPGDKFNCILSFRLPPTTSTTFYRLEMDPLQGEPEVQEPQLACNTADSGGCNDWFIDPVPVVNPDGSTSPGKSRARLNLVNTHGTGNITNEGDFYLTFHIHATRP